MNGDVIQEESSSEDDEASNGGAATDAQNSDEPAFLAKDILLHVANYVVEQVERNRAEEALLKGDMGSDITATAQDRLASYQQ